MILSHYEGYNAALLSQLSTKYYKEEQYFGGGDRYVIGGKGFIYHSMNGTANHRGQVIRTFSQGC
jgi:hypothetical protein